MGELNELQRACKVIDELIVMLAARDMFDNEMVFTYSKIDEGLKLIAERVQESGEYPVTMWLAEKMREHGYLPKS